MEPLQDTADGSRTLYSERYTQTFHSDKGAVTESKYVFLQASGVAERLRQRKVTAVLEVGFGTGLNFFLTADLALENKTSLRFVSLEQTLLPASTVEKLGFERYLQEDVSERYLSFRAGLPDEVAVGNYIFKLSDGVGLELRVGDATKQTFGENAFDAVYQDAFSPDANSELWTDTFFDRLYHALRPGGVLTTYSVKGEVRRRLQRLGFTVEKRPGPPGGKREMLWARRSSQS